MAFVKASGVELLRRRIERNLGGQGVNSTATRLLESGRLPVYLNAIKRDIPYKTGHLRNSLRWELRGRIMRLRLTAPYASAPNLIHKYGDYFEKTTRVNLGIFRAPSVLRGSYRYERYRQGARIGAQPEVSFKFYKIRPRTAASRARAGRRVQYGSRAARESAVAQQERIAQRIQAQGLA